MKNVLKKSAFIVVSILSILQIGTTTLTSKDNSFVESASSNQAIGEKSIKKLIGTGNEISNSKIYTQYAELENNYVLRFATAIKGDITSISYKRAEVDGHKENIKDVATVYRGIIADSKTYFYDGNDITTDETYAGNYYWACYTISYAKGSSLINTPINLSLSINGEEKEIIQKSLKDLMYVAVTDIKLSNINLYDNEIVFDLNNPTIQNLNATASPSNATHANDITYKIENTSIASVDDKGNITPLSEGKTTLSIKCDEVVENVTIRVVKLDDSSLINDSKEKLEDIGDTSIPGWYAKPNSTNISVSMKDGAISCISSKEMTKDLVTQFKYQPQDTDGNVYIGKYLIAFTITNSTSFNATFKCNLTGKQDVITSELIVNKNTSSSFIFVFNSKAESEYLTIKLMKKIGKGTLTINNIHFIALAD